MTSLYKACKEITGNGTFNYIIGNNDISIEAFDSIEAYKAATLSNNQENIVLIKDDIITINTEETLTPDSPKKSLVLFCDTLVNNGMISMTGKGPNILPHEYVIIQNDGIFDDVVIPAYANNRVERKTVSSLPYLNKGVSGNNGTDRQCGSGGQGAYSSTNSSAFSKRLGASGSGYAFGGGAGSGGKAGDSNTVFESNVDVDSIYPMRGASGFAYNRYTASGGVGHPAGEHAPSLSNTNYSGHNGLVQAQNIGVGGRIVIFCNTLINNGSIQANGVAAYSSDLWAAASGGSSGGGAVDIFYASSCQQGTITAIGGASGSIYQNNLTYGGGKGGDGSVTVSQLNYNLFKLSDQEISDKLKALYISLSLMPSMKI